MPSNPTPTPAPPALTPAARDRKWTAILDDLKAQIERADERVLASETEQLRTREINTRLRADRDEWRARAEKNQTLANRTLGAELLQERAEERAAKLTEERDAFMRNSDTFRLQRDEARFQRDEAIDRAATQEYLDGAGSVAVHLAQQAQKVAEDNLDAMIRQVELLTQTPGVAGRLGLLLWRRAGEVAAEEREASARKANEEGTGL